MLSPDALQVVDIARAAGAVILSRYGRRSLLVQDKDDGSPVTDADLAADALIRDRLGKAFEYPIVSEESAPPPPRSGAGGRAGGWWIRSMAPATSWPAQVSSACSSP
jgi:3'-phosphoadenosine 5'-phosphosulfate (PAPS) 3'-phosphatase